MATQSIAKSRRERQKQATRESILRVALEIAREQGWEAVTIRRIAELIEYTPPIVYEYFANKNALLAELQQQGFALLTAKMQDAADSQGDARESLLQVADAYVCFAYEQRELYQLMHDWVSAQVSLDKTLAWASSSAEIVSQCLTSWAQEQKITLSQPKDALEIAWSLLHGLISVEMLNRINGGQERVRLLARRALSNLLDAWQAQ